MTIFLQEAMGRGYGAKDGLQPCAERAPIVLAAATILSAGAECAKTSGANEVNGYQIWKGWEAHIHKPYFQINPPPELPFDPDSENPSEAGIFHLPHTCIKRTIVDSKLYVQVRFPNLGTLLTDYD